jgi:hypothetical protein
MTAVEFETWLVWLNCGMASTKEFNMTNWIELQQPEKGRLYYINRAVYEKRLLTVEGER